MSKERRYFHTEVGFNFRLTNLQAALGCGQLDRFAEILANKRRLLAWYREATQGLDLILNPTAPGVSPVCWLVAALFAPEFDAERLTGVARRFGKRTASTAGPFSSRCTSSRRTLIVDW